MKLRTIVTKKAGIVALAVPTGLLLVSLLFPLAAWGQSPTGTPAPDQSTTQPSDPHQGLNITSTALEIPEKVSVTGKVLNKTQGGGSVAGLEVTFHRYSDSAEKEKETTKAGSDGSYSFTGVATNGAVGFLVSVKYLDVDYYSEPLEFTKDATSKTVDLNVYETTTNGDKISVDKAHVLIDITEGTLGVMELRVVNNTGDRTFIGDKAVTQDGKKATLKLPVPAGAQNIQFRQGVVGSDVVQTDGGMVDTGPVPPGTKELVVAYDLPHDSSDFVFSRPMAYDTKSVDVFVLDVGAKVTADQLRSVEPVQADTTRYLHLTGGPLKASDTLTMKLTGLNKGGIQDTIVWVAVGAGIVIVGLAGSFFFLRRRGDLQQAYATNVPGAASAPAEDSGRAALENERKQLLVELADLDDRFEAGEISEELYQTDRSAMKQKLTEITRRLKSPQ